MKIHKVTISYTVQRREHPNWDTWVDSTGHYYGEEAGLQAAVPLYRDMTETFGADSVRIQRWKVTTETETVEAWEVATS